MNTYPQEFPHTFVVLFGVFGSLTVRTDETSTLTVFSTKTLMPPREALRTAREESASKTQKTVRNCPEASMHATTPPARRTPIVSWTTGGKALHFFVRGGPKGLPEFWVRDTEKICVLQSIFGNMLDIPMENLRLHRGSEKLRSGRAFRFYNVQPGTILTLNHWRPRVPKHWQLRLPQKASPLLLAQPTPSKEQRKRKRKVSDAENGTSTTTTTPDELSERTSIDTSQTDLLLSLLEEPYDEARWAAAWGYASHEEEKFREA